MKRAQRRRKRSHAADTTTARTTPHSTTSPADAIVDAHARLIVPVAAASERSTPSAFGAPYVTADEISAARTQRPRCSSVSRSHIPSRWTPRSPTGRHASPASPHAGSTHAWTLAVVDSSIGRQRLATFAVFVPTGHVRDVPGSGTGGSPCCGHAATHTPYRWSAHGVRVSTSRCSTRSCDSRG